MSIRTGSIHRRLSGVLQTESGVSVPGASFRPMDGGEVLRWIGPVVLSPSVSALIAVDAVSWRRSARLRKGREPPYSTIPQNECFSQPYAVLFLHVGER